ncbi:MAG: VanW family protein [Clostridia bacterium]|nr:VanW family protein [Clostridia bacterium]
MSFKDFISNNKKLLIIIASVIVGIFVLYVALGFYVDSRESVFPNTYLDHVDVSGKSPDELTGLLKTEGEKEYGAVSFNVTVGDITRTVLASDLSVAIDTEKAAAVALSRGRNGNFFTNPLRFIKSLFVDHVYATPITLDEELLEHLTAEFTKANTPPVDAGYVIDGDKMTLTPPVDGMMLDETEFADTLRRKFVTFSYDDVTIELKHAEAKPLDLDAVYEEVHATVADAKLEVVDGKNIVTPHVVGTDFDLKAAKEALAASPDKEVVIPLTLVQPKVTTLSIQSTLFQDTLSSKTTYYSPKKINRSHNVRLAASLINGTILNPGEVFSYNKVVGPRTYARGFREAAIFSQGEVVDGLGGGICQVSSTLYMAAVYADMKTVERKNHSFFVDYAPKGQDATVVYGSIDFKFENTSEYPIKIVAYARDNFITVTIKGTKTEEKTVQFRANTISTTGYTTKTVVDSSLKPGQRVVKQAGQKGMTMDVYRYVYDKNGNLISKSYENKTRYVPMTEIVHVGPAETLAPQTPVTPATPPAQPVTPPPVETPVTPPPAVEPEETPVTPEIPVEPETPAENEPTPDDTPSDEVSTVPDESASSDAGEENTVSQE